MDYIAESFKLVTDGHFFNFLISPVGLGLTVLILVLSAFTAKFRKIFIVADFGVWAYAVLYHFTLEKRTGLLGANMEESVSGLPGMVGFVLGFVLITGIILYFLLVRD